MNEQKRKKEHESNEVGGEREIAEEEGEYGGREDGEAKKNEGEARTGVIHLQNPVEALRHGRVVEAKHVGCGRGGQRAEEMEEKSQRKR